jgi:hypothetical protein
MSGQPGRPELIARLGYGGLKPGHVEEKKLWKIMGFSMGFHGIL